MTNDWKRDTLLKRIKRHASLAAIGLLGLGVAASLGVPPATASLLPQGVATTVTCYNGASHCTRYHYSFAPPGATTGAFHIYYTVQWSKDGGSYKVIETRWVNTSDKRVYWGSDGIYDPNGGYTTLSAGSSSTTFSIAPEGGSYTFREAQFTGSDKGIYHPKGKGVYSTSDENTVSWEYHVSGHTSFAGAYKLG